VASLWFSDAATTTILITIVTIQLKARKITRETDHAPPSGRSAPRVTEWLDSHGRLTADSQGVQRLSLGVHSQQVRPFEMGVRHQGTRSTIRAHLGRLHTDRQRSHTHV
jgi:hypothetical protein